MSIVESQDPPLEMNCARAYSSNSLRPDGGRLVIPRAPIQLWTDSTCVVGRNLEASLTSEPSAPQLTSIQRVLVMPSRLLHCFRSTSDHDLQAWGHDPSGHSHPITICGRSGRVSSRGSRMPRSSPIIDELRFALSPLLITMGVSAHGKINGASTIVSERRLNATPHQPPKEQRGRGVPAACLDAC